MNPHHKSAEAVAYPVTRLRVVALALATLLLAAAMGLYLWWAQTQPAFSKAAFAFAVLLVCGTVGLRAWWRSPQGTLVWTGRGWDWQALGATHVATGTVQAAFDLQSVLLLRWQAAGVRNQWLWVAESGDAARWLMQRRAVFSPVRAEEASLGAEGAR